MSTKTDSTVNHSLLKNNPVVAELLKSPEKRKALALFCREDIPELDYLLKNPWINLKTIVEVADRILDISPEISKAELLQVLCRETALLANAKAATCRAYDPAKNYLIASGAYNWNIERAATIPHEDTVAGLVIKTNTHYCVPDISAESRYQEKDKALSMGIHSLLALPIQVTDYESGIKKKVLIGT